MGEIEGSYRVLQTPGTRLGAQFNAGISTLEPGQSLSTNMAGGSRSHGRGLQIRVQGLDDSQEFFDVDVSYSSIINLPPFFNTSSLKLGSYIKVQGEPACVWLGLVTAAAWLGC